MNFGYYFKKCRTELELSQVYVAKKLGIHQSNISDWENDVSRPEYEKLIQLAEIYNVTLYQLLGLDDPSGIVKSTERNEPSFRSK